MILTIDVGNTRIKWGVFDNEGELKAHDACLNTELDMRPAAWQSCTRAVISNVAGEAVATQLGAILQQLDIPIHWATASTFACGVSNGYADPQQLGSDRWAALVAAWQYCHGPCVVVNAGTALTVDALATDGQQGIFLGGLIVPGFKLMLDGLYQNTAGIAAAKGQMRTFPTNTGDAVYTGALSAMVGAVASMMLKLEKDTGKQPHCILSGGDAVMLVNALRSYGQIANNVVIVDNLVLQGLLALEREFSRSKAE